MRAAAVSALVQLTNGPLFAGEGIMMGVGAFGFLAAGRNASAGNLGIEDQRLAMAWARWARNQDHTQSFSKTFLVTSTAAPSCQHNFTNFCEILRTSEIC